MSFYTLLTSRWETDAVALSFRGDTRTFRDLENGVARAAGYLREAGVEQGDRVALQLPKGPAWLELHLGALRIGAVSVPMNPAYTPSETEWILRDAAPKLHFQTAPDHSSASAIDPVDVSPEHPAALCYTSGTTGRPKGALLTHANFAATVRSLHEAWEWRCQDVLVHALPLFHIHGLIVAQLTALYAGAKTVWMERFAPEEAFREIASHRATVFMGVPTFYARFLAAAGTPDLTSIRLFTSGSAPLPAPVHEAFEARFGHRILERYGMTEIGVALSNPLHGERRSGTVGTPLPGVEVRLAESPGPAELLVRGPAVFAGYYGKPDATSEALVDGWMHTGDLATQDDDGYYRIVGRRTDVVLVGGLNVYPAEVEAALLGHVSIAEAAVFGVPDPDLGERLVAACVGTADPEAIRSSLLERLAPYKCPRVVAFVPDLPRNAMGKVDRRALRAEWSTPRVRDARLEDASEIVRRNQSLARETEGLELDDAVLREGVSSVFSGPRGAFYLIAEIAGRPVGQCMVTTEWSDWRNAPVWWIQSVYVEPAIRGKGVYAALHAEVARRAREAGAAGVRLYVDRRNQTAQAVYRRMGMTGDHYLVFEQMF